MFVQRLQALNQPKPRIGPVAQNKLRDRFNTMSEPKVIGTKPPEAEKSASVAPSPQATSAKVEEKANINPVASGLSQGDLIAAAQAKDQKIQALQVKIDDLEKNKKNVTDTTLGDKKVLDAVAKDGKMPICDCRVWMSKNRDIPKFGVTPAEAVILIAGFHKLRGDQPIHAITAHKVSQPRKGPDGKIVRDDEFRAVMDQGEVILIDRQAYQEVARLKGKYGDQRITAVFPGVNPQLPPDFKSAVQMGMSVAIPTAHLTAEQGGDALGSIVINV